MGRPVERINNFIGLVDWKSMLMYNIKSQDEPVIDNVIDNINAGIEDIRQYWLANPDLRVMQVLVNKDYIPNHWVYGAVYYKEDWEFLKEQKVPAREFLLWGSYGLDRKKFKWVLIKDMEISHVKSILHDVATGRQKNLHPFYKETFEKEAELDFKLIW